MNPKPYQVWFSELLWHEWTVKVKSPGLEEEWARRFVINLTLKRLSTGNWEIPVSVPHRPSWPLVSHSSHYPLPTHFNPSTSTRLIQHRPQNTRGAAVARGNPAGNLCGYPFLHFFSWTCIPLCDSTWKKSCKTPRATVCAPMSFK